MAVVSERGIGAAIKREDQSIEVALSVETRFVFGYAFTAEAPRIEGTRSCAHESKEALRACLTRRTAGN
jgi:hypothetical protein